MIEKIAKAAIKIPWKRIVQTMVPVAIDHVLDSIKSRKSSQGDRKAKTDRSPTLESHVQKIEDEFEEGLEAVRVTSTELSQHIQRLAEATKVVSARVAIALVLSGVSLIISVACGILLIIRHV